MKGESQSYSCVSCNEKNLRDVSILSNNVMFAEVRLLFVHGGDYAGRWLTLVRHPYLLTPVEASYRRSSSEFSRVWTDNRGNTSCPRPYTTM